jgi:hypothetical protein
MAIQGAQIQTIKFPNQGEHSEPEMLHKQYGKRGSET